MLRCQTDLQQDIGEFNSFLALIKSNRVTSYLEIGSKHGGSFWRISNTLPPGSRVVSVDLPHGSFKETEPHLIACQQALKGRGYDAHLFLTSSMDEVTKKSVKSLGPFDLCFIDANHTEPFVRHDWGFYGQMARMVAFHDIGWKPRPEPSKKMPIEVPIVWAEIRNGYRFDEIRRCPRDNGIGIIWR
jgi:hypothetical protein